MNFPLTTIQPSEVAALVGSVTTYGALSGFALRERADYGDGTPLLIASLSGVVLSIVALYSAIPFLRGAALVFFGLVVIATLSPVFVEGIREKQWYWPEAVIQLHERPKFLLLGLGLALVVAGSAALGALLLGDRSTTTISISPSGRYRISGTCVNGSCYVNECATPATCGSKNEGELKEETAVDIVCQIKGESTQAPDNRRSDVWDRLSTGLYVSDLFVSGTKNDHFAPRLPRCAIS